MKHFSTLEAYCKGINISPPKWEHFDIRRFKDNMKTVYHQMPKFKHEFYAIAIKLDGGGYASTGNYSTKDLKATIFFNSPYQILSWDIAPDWQGFYIIFSEDFYRNAPVSLAGRLSHHGGQVQQLVSPTSRRITEDFQFLLIDNTIPMRVSNAEAELYAKLLSDMHFEFDLNKENSTEIIANYLNILLLKVDRLYAKNKDSQTITQNQRAADLNLVSRFKTLLELNFQPGKDFEGAHPHQVKFYADTLNLHPNHFNAIVKRITEKSASEHIYLHILSLAKSRLTNTDQSIKEIAFGLYYEYPNHFANFFKNRMGMTPSQYRKSVK